MAAPPLAGDRHKTYALLWLAAIVLPLTAVKLAITAGHGPYGLDASYYFQIARHVARGDGLMTSVSLYYEGWLLPAKSHVYPLWPLLLGFCGRFFGLVQAANVLPKLFHVVDLLLLYAVATTVALQAGRFRISDHIVGLNVAHIMVALFGTNAVFFSTTSHPYTEGMAFALAFASILALARYTKNLKSFWAVAAGGLAALSYLTRTQMIGIAAASLAILSIASLRDRRWRLGTVLYAVAAVAVVTPWFLFLGFVPGLEFLGTPTLARIPLTSFQQFVQTDSWPSFIADRATGLLVAFDVGSPHSYVRSFGGAALLPPLAAAYWLWTRARSRSIPPLIQTTLIAYTIALAGMFFFFTLLLYHGRYFLPWLFGWRHGLTFLFSLLVAIPYLLGAERRWIRAIAGVLLTVSLLTGLLKLPAVMRESEGKGLSPAEAELVAVLNRSNGGKPTVLTTHAQPLSVFSDAYFHWIECSADPALTLTMLRKLDIDYVIVYEQERGCPFVRGLGDQLQLLLAFGEAGQRLYMLRRTEAGSPKTTTPSAQFSRQRARHVAPQTFSPVRFLRDCQAQFVEFRGHERVLPFTASCIAQ